MESDVNTIVESCDPTESIRSEGNVLRDGSETPRKKNKKHKKHKSKKKRKKKRDEKDSSSESGVESDQGSQTKSSMKKDESSNFESGDRDKDKESAKNSVAEPHDDDYKVRKTKRHTGKKKKKRRKEEEKQQRNSPRSRSASTSESAESESESESKVPQALDPSSLNKRSPVTALKLSNDGCKDKLLPDDKKGDVTSKSEHSEEQCLKPAWKEEETLQDAHLQTVDGEQHSENNIKRECTQRAVYKEEHSHGTT
ncbi:serine/arginine repetitive matrix protein 2 [Tachysurus ichikawai]